jgi:hypothetical protein
MKMEYKCLFCGKDDVKNMGLHLKMAHKMTIEDYEKWIEENKDEVLKPNTLINNVTESEGNIDEFNEFDEEDVSDIITTEDLKRSKFPKIVTFIDKPLKDFLEEYKITEKELIEVIRAYKIDSVVPINQSMSNRIKNAEIKALELSDGDDIETLDLDVAEALTKKYGFKCTAVTSNPKTWILKKI